MQASIVALLNMLYIMQHFGAHGYHCTGAT